MIIEIRSIDFKKWYTSRVISLRYINCYKVLFVVLLTVTCSIDASNNLYQKEHNGNQYSYGRKFVDGEEAEAVEANVRLSKIPCNFTTKTNCIYVERQKLFLPIRSLMQRNHQNAHEIVVSWAPYSGVTNTTLKFVANNGSSTNSSYVRKNPQNDFYNLNWIFEFLACMMLASAFEICLLVLRNIRNISLAFFRFWSALNISLQKLCYTCTSSNKSDQHRKRNVAHGKQRTLSYIFAILTWRASQTTKAATSTTESNLRDERNENGISYGHVTTMGDLLLLILFTHVYYQRQRFYQDVNREVNADTEQLRDNKNEKKDESNKTHRKFYDTQDNYDCNSAFNKQSFHRRSSYKCSSHFCGSMYQQISLSLLEQKSTQTKLTTLNSCAPKMPYLTCCSGFVWYNCCFCQYSCRSCCFCCSNCRLWNQRCYIYLPLCNAIYCCCFCKSMKYFHDVNYQYCCYLCCWQDVYHTNKLTSHASYCCSHCHFYCCFCNTFINKTPVHAVNLFLIKKIKTSYSYTDYHVFKLLRNKENYSTFLRVDGQSYFLYHMTDSETIFLYKHSYYQFAVDVLSCLFPQYLLTIKNCQPFLKWKRLHVGVVVTALIDICASCGGANYNHPSSVFNKCNKHIPQYQKNKRRRRGQQRLHQLCKVYRPQHYFYATLIQCVKRQKAKKLSHNFVYKLTERSRKLLTTTTTNYEHSLVATAQIPQVAMIRPIRRVRGSKPNIVWLLIGLIWFEGPKMVSCNVIITYQNQQQHEQQQQQAANTNKEPTSNIVDSNFDYKIGIFNKMKVRNSNTNNNYNNNNYNNNNSNNKNKNYNSNSASASTSSTNRNYATSNRNRSSTNILPILTTPHLKHYCKSSEQQKLIRSLQRVQRVQRALKTKANLDTSVTSSASLNYNNVNEDLDLEPMPSSAFHTINEGSHAQSDLMRLESIKHQILFKLGLTRKPNVSHPLPKQFIWDTIYRADGIKSFHDFSNMNNFNDHHHFKSKEKYPYWSRTPSKDFSVVSMNKYQQRHQREDRSYNSNSFEDEADNTKRSVESFNVEPKLFAKARQQQQQTYSKYNNNDVMFRKGPTITSTSKKLNKFAYTKTTTIATNKNKFLSHTNETINNSSTISKQAKHQQVYKNSQHLTTAITSVRKPTTIHQQYTNNSNNNKNLKNNENNNRNNSNNRDHNNYNSNNKYNDVNNSNNEKNIDSEINIDSNNNINIILVQKHLRNNNKYIEEAKKFTYLTDIKDSEDGSNIMEEHRKSNCDDSHSILRKKNHLQYHHHHHDANDYPIQLQLQPNDDGDDGRIDDYKRLNRDAIVNIGGAVSVTRNVNSEHEFTNDDEVDSYHGDGEAYKDGYSDENYRHNQYQHRQENYFSKLDAFNENEDFFGSTQEIITFGEKGKMYKNHRLVEFSHQNSDNPKQKLHVRHAEIHIRIDKISLRNKSRAGSGIKRKRLKIWIFQLIENNYTYKGFDHVAQFCASFEVDTSHLGWKKFDMTTTVKEWYARREGEKLRLLIDCTGCGKLYAVHLFNGNNTKRNANFKDRRIPNEKRNAYINDINSKNIYNVTGKDGGLSNLPYNQTLVIADKDRFNIRNSVDADKAADEDTLNSSRPFLVLHTEARRQRRVRRRAINCNGALHGQCCKESFYVSFKALGWDDWIIAPRGYFANYCRGDCTGPYRTPDTFQTFHAHFIEEYRKMGLLNGMQPCCAPIKFSSMSLIYYGDEGIIKRDLPKMVVDECGCP